MTDFKVVIPSRYDSSRLPGKPLVDIRGRTMIEHVYRQAEKSGASEIVIATDDHRVQQVAEAFGATVEMTHANHASGTDRIAEVVARRAWDKDTIIVNLQGDEPLIPPTLIHEVAAALQTHQQASVATLATPIHKKKDIFDPHIVKVVMNSAGYALYFSRAAIPWDRDCFSDQGNTEPPAHEYYRHLGLYAYRAAMLQKITSEQPCVLERAEQLEQLRVLWHGDAIHVTVIDEPPGHGIDTPEDLERVRAIIGT
ncbi:MAG TPA: 3-deoxy-manno-octulosonate cytidylyltransferase [Gammaproteobacteria bacterium]|mgnify:CR=1 FL=1|nr:3-deoxy-manno-octulosonate cytidylyltransferase [Gammaproteobacteria bacterium]